MDEVYWKCVLQEDFNDPTRLSCRFCGQELTTVSSRRAHEGYHVTEYLCAECPGRIWRRAGNARGHNQAHHTSPRYHAPRRLAGNPELLPRWSQAYREPVVEIRRLIVPDQPAPETMAEAPPKEDTPFPELETADLDLLQQIMEAYEREEVQVDQESMTQTTPIDGWTLPTPTNQTGMVTSSDARWEHLEAARRDVASARQQLDSAMEHLNSIEAHLMMEAGAHELWAAENW